MMTKAMFTKFVYFMTPRARVLVLGHVHLHHIGKMHYFFKYLLLYTQEYIRQTKYIVIMTKERFTKIINLITPVMGGLVLRREHAILLLLLSTMGHGSSN